jgi:CheY-like chemotaxis protein
MTSESRQPSVLVIDDDFVTRRIAEAALSQRGYRVAAFGEGRRALEWLEAESAAIIVTDIFMPDIDGLEIVLAVRSRCPDARILAISGGSRLVRLDYLSIAERLGADATLTKPFRPSDLLAAVEALTMAAKTQVA